MTPPASPVDWDMEMVMPLGVLESIHSFLAKMQADIHGKGAAARFATSESAVFSRKPVPELDD